MKKISLTALIIFVLLLALMSTVQAQSPQQTLNQYISDLQKNPNDNALREKIIALVQTMKPAPPIPDKARKYMDRGIAAIEGAKGEEDFRAASNEFTEATKLAPWLGDAYRNLSIAQDKSGQFEGALKNLRLYLLTSPSPADESWAKSLINKVEYRNDKAKEKAAATKEMWNAINSDNADDVRVAIDKGADANLTGCDAKKGTYFSYTPLTFAAKNDKANAARALLDKGANVNLKECVYQGHGGDSALMWAASGGCLDIVRALIEKRADVNARNAEGVTALTMAVSNPAVRWTAELTAKARRDKAEVIRILKDAGAKE